MSFWPISTESSWKLYVHSFQSIWVKSSRLRAFHQWNIKVLKSDGLEFSNNQNKSSSKALLALFFKMLISFIKFKKLPSIANFLTLSNLILATAKHATERNSIANALIRLSPFFLRTYNQLNETHTTRCLTTMIILGKSLAITTSY